MIEILKKNYSSNINYFEILGEVLSRKHHHHHSSSSSSIDLSSLSSLGFSSINSNFALNINQGLINTLLASIGTSLNAAADAYNDLKDIAEGLEELLRVFTNGDGESSSSNNELKLINSQIFFNNHFHTSLCEKIIFITLIIQRNKYKIFQL
jgi:hypothetical protein